MRVARLTVAADQAVDAARGGALRALRAHLQHFDTLASAIWTVQDAIYGHETALDRVLPESQVAAPAMDG